MRKIIVCAAVLTLSACGSGSPPTPPPPPSNNICLQLLSWSPLQNSFELAETASADCGSERQGERWFPVRNQHDSKDVFLSVPNSDQHVVEHAYQGPNTRTEFQPTLVYRVRQGQTDPEVMTDAVSIDPNNWDFAANGNPPRNFLLPIDGCPEPRAPLVANPPAGSPTQLEEQCGMVVVEEDEVQFE